METRSNNYVIIATVESEGAVKSYRNYDVSRLEYDQIEEILALIGSMRNHNKEDWRKEFNERLDAFLDAENHNYCQSFKTDKK